MSRTNWIELLERGDRAASSGDAASLVDVALALSTGIGDPLAQELVDLAHDCEKHTIRAQQSWPALRKAVAHRISIAGT